MARVICPDAVFTHRRAASVPRGVAPAAKPARPRGRRWPLPSLLARALNAAQERAGHIIERRRLRAEILHQVPVAQGEHVLVVVCDGAGAWVIPTDRALYYQEGGSWSRIGWEQVLNLNWDDAQHALILVASTPRGPNRTTLRLPERTPLVDLARERVSSTYLLSSRASLADHGEAVVTARRQPGSGQIMWQISLDDHADHTEPALQAQIDTVIERLRGHIQA